MYTTLPSLQRDEKKKKKNHKFDLNKIVSLFVKKREKRKRKVGALEIIFYYSPRTPDFFF